MGFPLYISDGTEFMGGIRNPSRTTFFTQFSEAFFGIQNLRTFELVENWLEGSNSSYCGCLGKSFWVETPEGLVWPNLGRIGGSVKGSFLPLKDCGLRPGSRAEEERRQVMQTHLTVIRSVTFDTTTVVLARVQLMSSFIFFFQASTYPQPFHLGCFINIKVRNKGDTQKEPTKFSLP